MDYRALGRTGVKVSRLCLGTMTFGEQNSEAEGHAQMDYAFDRDINIVDASEIYPIPPKPETQGRTEAIIGTWLAARKARDKVVIATKVAGGGKMVWVRKNETATRQSPGQIMEAVEASLKRLKTDHIDLYPLHWPDRPMRICSPNRRSAKAISAGSMKARCRQARARSCSRGLAATRKGTERRSPPILRLRDGTDSIRPRWRSRSRRRGRSSPAPSSARPISPRPRSSCQTPCLRISSKCILTIPTRVRDALHLA